MTSFKIVDDLFDLPLPRGVDVFAPNVVNSYGRGPRHWYVNDREVTEAEFDREVARLIPKAVEHEAEGEGEAPTGEHES